MADTLNRVLRSDDEDNAVVNLMTLWRLLWISVLGDFLINNFFEKIYAI